MTLTYRTESLEEKTVEIPRGNWDAWSLANFLSYYLDGYKVVYDEGSLAFNFLPSLRITRTDRSAWKYLGFPSWTPTNTLIPYSIDVINLSTVQRIHVETNLTINNIPTSGRLACIPVDQSYGEMIKYFDADGLNRVLCLDHVIGRLEIWLTDQEGNPLEDYLLPDDYEYQYPAWQICLSITPTDNAGYTSFIAT